MLAGTGRAAQCCHVVQLCMNSKQCKAAKHEGSLGKRHRAVQYGHCSGHKPGNVEQFCAHHDTADTARMSSTARGLSGRVLAAAACILLAHAGHDNDSGLAFAYGSFITTWETGIIYNS